MEIYMKKYQQLKYILGIKQMVQRIFMNRNFKSSSTKLQFSFFFSKFIFCHLVMAGNDYDHDEVPREKFLTQNTKINKLFRKLRSYGVASVTFWLQQCKHSHAGSSFSGKLFHSMKYLGSQLAVFNHDIYETNLDNDDATNGLHMLESSSTQYLILKTACALKTRKKCNASNFFGKFYLCI